MNLLYEMGDDALNNQASVIIDAPKGLTWTQGDNLKFRISSFKIPSYAILFYDVQYKGNKIQKPKRGNEEEKSITLPFRCDRYYKIYKELKNWGRAIYDHWNGDAGKGDVESLRTTVTVIVDDGPTYIFKGCIFAELPEIEFDQTSDGDVITVQFKMNYLESYEKE